MYIVQVAGEELGTDLAESPELMDRYGSMPATMFTLFKTISGGENWGPVAQPLIYLHPGYASVYIVFISFTVFAVLNVVTGIFVETAMIASQKDMDNVLLEEMASYKDHMNELQNIFRAVDSDGSGTITWEEFEEHVQNEKVRAYFRKLGLELHDPHQLFTLLDFDGDGEMCCEEFVEGFTQLKGQAKSLDLARVRHHILDVHHSVQILTKICEEGFCLLGGEAFRRHVAEPVTYNAKRKSTMRRGSSHNLFPLMESSQDIKNYRASRKGTFLKAASQEDQRRGSTGSDWVTL